MNKSKQKNKNIVFLFLFFKQKTAYEMRISDWSSDVCSSDLGARRVHQPGQGDRRARRPARAHHHLTAVDVEVTLRPMRDRVGLAGLVGRPGGHRRILGGGSSSAF